MSLQDELDRLKARIGEIDVRLAAVKAEQDGLRVERLRLVTERQQISEFLNSRTVTP